MVSFVSKPKYKTYYIVNVNPWFNLYLYFLYKECIFRLGFWWFFNFLKVNKSKIVPEKN